MNTKIVKIAKRWNYAVIGSQLDLLDAAVSKEGKWCTRAKFVSEAIKEKVERSQQRQDLNDRGRAAWRASQAALKEAASSPVETPIINNDTMPGVVTKSLPVGQPEASAADAGQAALDREFSKVTTLPDPAAVHRKLIKEGIADDTRAKVVQQYMATNPFPEES